MTTQWGHIAWCVVAATIVALHVVLRLLLSCCVFGVVIAVVVPRMVLRALSSHPAWCCRRCRWAALCRGRGRHARAITVAVVVPCGAVVAVVVTPHVVLRLLLSCCAFGVVIAVVTPRVVLWALSSHCAWCCGCCHWAMLCRSRGRHARAITVAVVTPCGAVVAVVVMPRVVSRSCRRVVWCCGRGGCYAT